ncbi:MAG TPA: hypothetical protein GX707_13920, partial [Epulopiscium sp.]|nr:hypothetical protein [Candidatus Epulonipiscium sp.]
DVITQKLEDGTVEKLIGEELEKGIQKSLQSLLGSYGDINKVIEKQIKSVMVPYLENYDYSKYILKLDTVLVDILKSTSLDNKEMLENFKDLMTPEDRKTIKVSEIFKVWQEQVSKKVDTSELEINYDDGVSYDDAEVTLNVEYEDKGWSIYDRARVFFECEKDEEMNIEIRIRKWENEKGDGWDIEFENTHDISSLRYLSKLEVFLMRLSQAGTKVIIDTKYEEDWVEVEAEPEADFS